MFSRLSKYAARSVLLPVWLAVSIIQAGADALADLNKAFLDAYGLAASHSLAELRRRAPIFVNRFDRAVSPRRRSAGHLLHGFDDL
jgi:hypothetical protein